MQGLRKKERLEFHNTREVTVRLKVVKSRNTQDEPGAGRSGKCQKRTSGAKGKESKGWGLDDSQKMRNRLLKG